jgi:hypothetical protein
MRRKHSWLFYERYKAGIFIGPSEIANSIEWTMTAIATMKGCIRGGWYTLTLLAVSGQGLAVWAGGDAPRTPDNTTKLQMSVMAKETKVTLVQATQRALEKVPGSAVQAELQKKGKKTFWEVTIATESGLDRVYVDGDDGSYLVLAAPSHGEE